MILKIFEENSRNFKENQEGIMGKMRTFWINYEQNFKKNFSKDRQNN